MSNGSVKFTESGPVQSGEETHRSQVGRCDVHPVKKIESQPPMRNDVVNAVGKRDAIDERTMERLSHDTVDVSIAAIGSQQVEILRRHGLDMLCPFLYKGNDRRLSALRRLDARRGISCFVLFEELDRQPAFGITTSGRNSILRIDASMLAISRSILPP